MGIWGSAASALRREGLPGLFANEEDSLNGMSCAVVWPPYLGWQRLRRSDERWIALLKDWVVALTTGNDVPLRFLLRNADYDIYTQSVLEAELRAAEGREVIIDFANVRYMDSSALNVFARLYKRLRAGQGAEPHIRFQNVSPHLTRLLEIVGFQKLFDVSGTTRTPA
jgi:anti-anti-sigma factor